jgi:tRNA pseudouridine38-40 synthase
MAEVNLRLVLSFDGSSYSGWQRQKNARSVQAEIERALSETFGKIIKINGIGRTDAGAHAVNYTANFKLPLNPLPCGKLTLILNRRLPQDIRIIRTDEVKPDFHSRFSAQAREYVYSILMLPKIDRKFLPYLPFYSRYTYILEENLDFNRLRKACELFRGEHSFRNFCYGYKKEINFIRRIYYLRVHEIRAAALFFIKGNGFLNGMIRSIISVCLNYARRKIEIADISDALEGRMILRPEDRTPVPARGLLFKRGYFKVL